ncbi:hypothetical protein I3843_16G097200 [Carya illinoinensis]|nr:hypothetical protein I3843_16G097200 [Carya illinoinensis]
MANIHKRAIILGIANRPVTHRFRKILNGTPNLNIFVGPDILILCSYQTPRPHLATLKRRKFLHFQAHRLPLSIPFLFIWNVLESNGSAERKIEISFWFMICLRTTHCSGSFS